MNKVCISIVVPCYNAVGRVEDTLHALALQTANPKSFEVLVVDNNSRDARTLEEFVKQLNLRTGNFRFIAEANPGLTEVRRAGVDQAAYPYVIFIDDDAVPLCSYVERMADAITKYSPDVIGGSLLPFPEAAIGRQFDHTFAGWWSLRHYGSRDRWLTDGEYFLGANFGALRSILLEHGFDPAKGRKGGDLLGGEELWLGDPKFRRWYCSGAPVFHKVTEARMGPEYLTRRMLANLSRDRSVARWPDVARAFASAGYTPIKTAWMQIRFRLGLASRLAMIRMKAR